MAWRHRSARKPFFILDNVIFRRVCYDRILYVGIHLLLFYRIFCRSTHGGGICGGIFQGGVIPIPFFPEKIREIVELLPFAAMQNVSFRVYSGDLAGKALEKAVFLQVFWLIVLIAAGKGLNRIAMKKIVVQGG